jgi:site-specific DNA-cytosine methylase
MARVLVACEFSGIVREAFSELGHDAWSCDLLPTEIPGNHYQGDIFEFLDKDSNWDLMIAHPPCTYLSYAGMASWNKPGREQLREKAMSFFMEIINAPVERICVENPRGLPHQRYRIPDQVIHPYFFGEPFMKRTGLWLKNLPKLLYYMEESFFKSQTSCEKPAPNMLSVRKRTGQIKKRYWMDTPGLPAFKSGHLRSKTFASIAKAMAEQWGGLL